MNQPKNSQLIFSDKRVKVIVLSLSVVIVLLATFLVWNKVQSEEQLALMIENVEQKNALRDDLDDLIDEHEMLKDENIELSDQLFSKDSLINAYSNEIKNLLRSQADLNKARVKIKRLKEISKKYVNALDSLYILNANLLLENDSVKKANRYISNKNRDLVKTNKNLSEKVSTASVLKLEDISIEGLYYRASGREVTTSRANKIQNFKICYTILENQIADKGEKELYVRILDGKGNVLNVSNMIQELELSDTTIQYTTKYTIDYQNTSIKECQLWTRGNVLSSGTFTFEFLIDEIIIGIHQVKFR
jgi:hypothetical protein